MFKNYFKTALRNLNRNRLFSFINIGGLSLGLAACMLILLYIGDEKSFDQFHEMGNRTYLVGVNMTNGEEKMTIGSSNAIHGPSFQAEIPEIEKVIRTQGNVFVATLDGEVVNQEVLFADSEFFNFFSFPLISGNPDQVLRGNQSMVLTEATAKKYFGTTDALGKSIDFKIGNEFMQFQITGIAKDLPQNSSLQFEILLPFQFQEDRGWTDQAWLGFYMNTFVQLTEGSNPDHVNPKMNEIFSRNIQAELANSPGFNQKVEFFLEPFLNIHLNAEMKDPRNGLTRVSNPVYSLILSGIGIFILLIACINFVNLTIARSLNRAKEVGIRKVTGGKKHQLIFQFLAESYLLTFLAFVFGLFLTQLALPTFSSLSNKVLKINYLLEPEITFAFLGLFLLTGLLAGFYPALVLSDFSPVKTLYNRVRLTQRNFLTRGLVVLQFVLAVCLMIATMVVYSQFNFLTKTDLGYNDKDLVVFEAAPRGPGERKLELLKKELLQQSSIKSVAAFNGNYNQTVAKIDGQDVDFSYISIDQDFLNTLEIPLVEGRNFSADFSSDPTESIIVNESFVKMAGWESAVGKEVDFHWKNKKMKVIGVVKDYHFASLKESINPLVMTQDPQYQTRSLLVKLAKNSSPELIKTIKSKFHELIPFMPFDYSFEANNNLKKYEQEAKWKQMIGFAAFLSILVSAIGLFALSNYDAESRKKEIAIRKVLGANSIEITGILSGRFAILVGLGIILALPLSYYGATTWLESFAFRIDLTWWYFGVAGIFALGLAMVTVGFQAFTAAQANPSDSLKSE